MILGQFGHQAPDLHIKGKMYSLRGISSLFDFINIHLWFTQTIPQKNFFPYPLLYLLLRHSKLSLQCKEIQHFLCSRSFYDVLVRPFGFFQWKLKFWSCITDWNIFCCFRCWPVWVCSGRHGWHVCASDPTSRWRWTPGRWGTTHWSNRTLFICYLSKKKVFVFS